MDDAHDHGISIEIEMIVTQCILLIVLLWLLIDKEWRI